MKTTTPVLLLFFPLLSILPNARGMEKIAAIGGELRGIGKHEDLIYLAQRDSLIILNVRDPKNIKEITRYAKENEIIDEMVMRWPVVFYIMHHPGSYYHHVKTLDVTTATNAREIKLLEEATSKGYELATSGTTLMVALGIPQFYNISNPLHPIPLEFNEMYFDVNQTSRTTKLAIPPRIVYSHAIHNIRIEGKQLHVLNEELDIDEFDLKNPFLPVYSKPAEKPVEIKARMNIPLNDKGRNKEIIINNKYKVCLTSPTNEEDNNRDLVLLDTTVAGKPHPIDVLESGCPPSYGVDAILDFWMSGKYLVVFKQIDHNTAGSTLAFSIHDLTNPEQPLYKGVFEGLDGHPEEILVSDDIVYVAEGGNGLSIFKF